MSVHDCPFFFFPHCPVVTPRTVVATHWRPGSQSASLMQDALHAPFEQRYGEQSTICADLQVPWPSQARAVSRTTDPEHDAATQGVLAGKSAHAPAPSQRPVFPQVDGLWALHSGSGNPASTKRQRPIEPVWSHVTQGPLQATLQHLSLEQ